MPTAILTVRPLQNSDADRLYALTSDPEVARYMRFSAHTSPEQAAALIEEYTAPGGAGYALVERETGRFAGVFACKKGEEKGELTLSVLLDKRLWNRGCATDVLRRMLPILRRELGARLLTAYVVGSNGGSRRVLEKCGFHVERVKMLDDLPDGLYIYRYDLEQTNGKDKEDAACAGW